MNVYYYTLGCKVNQYETQAIKSAFLAEGFFEAETAEQADIFVLNSCTVTQNADKKTKQQLRRFKKVNPQGVVVLLGCMPQAYPEISNELPQADIIMGSVNKLNVVKNVKKFLQDKTPVVDITPHSKDTPFETMEVNDFSEKTRAFIKIQDGCNRYCSYCIIPTSRGRLRSKPLEELKQELQSVAQAGYQEVVLVGINLCFYGAELHLKLLDAVKATCETEGIKRVRLGSLEPELITREDALAMASYKEFCPQFHLSLQHGSDGVLKRMNRHYTAKEYLEIVKMLGEVFPNAAFTTDFMVGFPGETEEEFNEALQFLKACRFSKIHVFAYSKRAGTKAYDMPNQVDAHTKHLRSKEAIAFGQTLTESFFNAQIGQTAKVLIETESGKNLYEGYSENYTPVKVVSAKPLQNQIVTVTLTENSGEFMVGELV